VSKLNFEGLHTQFSIFLVRTSAIDAKVMDMRYRLLKKITRIEDISVKSCGYAIAEVAPACFRSCDS
jgi:hypothetical protein